MAESKQDSGLILSYKKVIEIFQKIIDERAKTVDNPEHDKITLIAKENLEKNQNGLNNYLNDIL